MGTVWNYDNDFCPNCGSMTCPASCYYGRAESEDAASSVGAASKQSTADRIFDYLAAVFLYGCAVAIGGVIGFLFGIGFLSGPGSPPIRGGLIGAVLGAAAAVWCMRLTRKMDL